MDTEHKRDQLKIALMGTRGIPARYGGFETFAEELSTRLVERGHAVTVYGRRAFGATAEGPEIYRGVRLRTVPTIMHKYLETPLHAFFSFLDLFRQRFDVVLLCNAANSPFSWLARLRGVPIAINVDGIERHRSKWNRIGKAWYRLGEFCSVLFADRIIADARIIADYYRRTYGSSSTVIAYGANRQLAEAGEVLDEFGLSKNRYLLYVSRLEPENNALGVIQAYRQVETDMPLVIVGDAPYAKEYIGRLKEAADGRVIFTGYQFGAAYRELLSNCYLYVQATEVGGTHPALIEAMACGNCVIANGTPENLEVLSGAGIFYYRNNFSSLTARIQEMIASEEQVQLYRQLARQRAERCYDWDVVTGQYEKLFDELLQRAPDHGLNPVISKG